MNSFPAKLYVLLLLYNPFPWIQNISIYILKKKEKIKKLEKTFGQH